MQHTVLFKGAYTGGNPGTAILTRTKRGGAVIWGSIRDNQQVVNIDNINVSYSGSDPTAIVNVTIIGMNTPVRIGRAVYLPGDVVLGTPAGVIFIPPHLAELVDKLAYVRRIPAPTAPYLLISGHRPGDDAIRRAYRWNSKIGDGHEAHDSIAPEPPSCRT